MLFYFLQASRFLRLRQFDSRTCGLHTTQLIKTLFYIVDILMCMHVLAFGFQPSVRYGSIVTYA